MGTSPFAQFEPNRMRGPSDPMPSIRPIRKMKSMEPIMHFEHSAPTHSKQKKLKRATTTTLKRSKTPTNLTKATPNNSATTTVASKNKPGTSGTTSLSPSNSHSEPTNNATNKAVSNGNNNSPPTSTSTSPQAQQQQNQQQQQQPAQH